MMLPFTPKLLRITCIFACILLMGLSVRAQTISLISPIQTSYAPGTAIAVIGVSLHNASTCDTLQLTGPQTYNLRDSIDYTSVTGSNDTLFVILPLDMPCGNYDMTLLQHTGCNTNGMSFPFAFTVADSISFDYDDPFFCVGDTNPTPNLYTSHNVPPIWSSQSGGLFLNSTTGEIYLTTASLITDNVIATTAGTACFASDTFEVTVKDITAGYTLTYPSDSPCGKAGGVFNGVLEPDVPILDTFGTFSSSPSLVVWTNIDSGFIDLENTPPGNYVIYYDSNPDSCYATASFNLVVVEPDRAQFDYLPQYCATDDTIYPAITLLPPNSGGATGFQNGGLGFVTPDINTGAVALGNLTPGQYAVAYSPASIFTCGETVRDTFDVIAGPNASFTYPFDTFCLSSPNQFPTPQNVGVYFDTAMPPNLIILDDSTGELDVANSATGGPYTIFHAIDDGTCQDTAFTLLYVQDPSTATVSYQQTRFCQSGIDPSPVFTTGLLGGTFISTPTCPGLDPVTGTIDLSITPADTYAISYSLTIATCSSVEPVGSIIIDDTIPLDFVIPNLICEDTGFVPIPITGNSAAADSIWFNLYLGASDFTAQGIFFGDSLSTDIIAPNGNYELVMTYTNGVCQDTVSHFFALYDRPDPTFYYLDTLLCQNADDPIPFVASTGGGTFYNLDTAGFVSLDPQTGEINLFNSQPGNYVIYYNADPICPSLDSDSIVIIGSNEAFFFYDAPEPCRDRDSIYATRQSTFGQGTFTITPTGCPIDSVTGNIAMSTCDPGTYTVTHTLGSSTGDCEAIYITEITVSQHDTSAALDFPQLVYCPSDSIAIPMFQVDSSGFFPGQTGLVFDNDSLGTINLQLSQPDTFVVRYEIEGVCPQTLEDSIIILPYTSPGFYYGTPFDTTQFYCTTDNNPIAFPETPNGTFLTFTNQRDTVPWVDPATGEFFLDSVSSNSESPFTICYTPNSGCTFTQCNLLVVNLGPEDAAISIDDTLICQGDTVTFRINGGGDSQLWLMDNAPVDSSLSFTPNPDSLYDGITISVLVGDNQNCNTQIDTVLTVFPVPQVVFTDVPTIVSSNNFVDIDVQDPFTDGVTFNWSTGSIGQVNFQPDMGAEGPGLIGQDETISSLIALEDESSPAQIIFIVTPSTAQCTGISVSDTIQVNPLDQPIFVPEVFTPNGDGINDTWQIQWRQDFDLSQYTMLVYNRAGAEVLEMSPVVATWDGGSLPDGVYWWKLLNQTGRRVLSGGLTIRRK